LQVNQPKQMRSVTLASVLFQFHFNRSRLFAFQTLTPHQYTCTGDCEKIKKKNHKREIHECNISAWANHSRGNAQAFSTSKCREFVYCFPMSHRFHQRKKKGFLDCVSRHCAQLEQIVRKADASGATRTWFFKKKIKWKYIEPVPFQWRVRPANSNSQRPTTHPVPFKIQQWNEEEI
jgi:hypothetical protein